MSNAKQIKQTFKLGANFCCQGPNNISRLLHVSNVQWVKATMITAPRQEWLPLCTLESTAFKADSTISKATSFRVQLPEDKFGGILETRV